MAAKELKTFSREEVANVSAFRLFVHFQLSYGTKA
jgi:hypothetical protein